MKQFSLSIPKPCHENWEAMKPEDKGRFCSACQKTVIDFSTMGDAQIAQFFKKPTGSVCGRFEGDQLNRIVNVPRKRLPWIKYFFTVALPAFLFSKKAEAQGEVQRILGKTSLCQKPLKADTAKLESFVVGFVSSKMKVETLKTFKGHVVNLTGEPVPFATVSAKNEGRLVVADSTGTFSMKYLRLPLFIEVSSIGYQTQTVVLNDESNSSIILKPSFDSYETLGIVAITTVRKKKTATETVFPKKAETPVAAFSVYPNPVNASGVLTIDPKTLEAGKYNLAIISSNGNSVQSGTLVFENKKAKQTITLQSFPAGVYFIQLTTGTNAKNFTEKILVQ